MTSRSAHAKRRAGVLATIVSRFREENMMQTSAALAFTTLLALVPLVTLVISVAATVPFFDVFIKRLDAVLVENLLPSGTAGTIAGHLATFAGKAQKLTLAGVAVLVLTAVLLLHTIERAFNHVWRVKPRPLLARLKLYVFVMALWPFILGAIAGAVSYAVTTSLGFVEDSGRLEGILLKGVSVGMLGLFFGFLYYAVPNAPVSRSAAAASGLLATLAFAGMQKGFELYLSSFGTFKSIYGTFAAVPIFLIWLQLSWAVILLGGLVAATVFRPAGR